MTAASDLATGTEAVGDAAEERRERGQVLLVANAYPSESALYRNAFIHRRVLGYLAAGISVDVFYLHPPVSVPYSYEFDGVRVTVGDAEAYAQHIAQFDYRKVLVHFASPAMLDPIRRHRPRTPVIVWIHGFEAEAWHRRWFNITDTATSLREALAKKSAYHDPQLEFIGWLISTSELDVTVVHVSEWFRRAIVEPDVRVATRDPHIIPNVVDEELFSHRAKGASDRLNILSIRPYASRKYANDLAVAAVLELSRRPYFDRLSFTFCGEGALFQETTAPLTGLGNVTVEEGFLRQEEVAERHAEHGVFLSPTRFDSQGVSMCEAMSSGLVPVSTRIAAIPEFVAHGETGLLAPPEDASELADMIEVLYYDPELYLGLSAAAATSIRRQCGRQATVDREVELIGVDR